MAERPHGLRGGKWVAGVTDTRQSCPARGQCDPGMSQISQTHTEHKRVHSRPPRHHGAGTASSSTLPTEAARLGGRGLRSREPGPSAAPPPPGPLQTLARKTKQSLYFACAPVARHWRAYSRS